MTGLDLIVSFASAARHASFARAARELGLSPSAVAKNVARLEAQLGMRLFHRYAALFSVPVPKYILL